MRPTFMSALDYDDILYCHAAPSTFQLLNPIYHCALCFIRNAKSHTHHCSLYQLVGWSSLHSRRNSHLMSFIYKTLLFKLPEYLTSLLSFKSNNCVTRSSNYLTLDIHHICISYGKTGLSHYAPFKWNELQTALSLQAFIPLREFKALLSDFCHDLCNCL